jgi:tetratricopeptide (TPR) repeat protein
VYDGDDKVPKLPIVDLCADRVVLPVEGVDETVPEQTSPIKLAWQRWNDYGIGCLIEGGAEEKKGELRQAEEAFKALLKHYPKEAAGHAYLNLARVYEKEGRLREAVQVLEKAREAGAPWWTVAWFNGLVTLESASSRAGYDAAIATFKGILDPDKQPRERGFDFTKDYMVINALGRALFERALKEVGNPSARDPFLLEAIEQYERTLSIDPENLDAHYGLHQCFRLLGRAMPKVKAAEQAPATDEAAMQEMTRTLLDGTADQTARVETAARLARAVTALGAEAVSATRPKRLRFEALLPRIEAYFHRENDAALKTAAAHVLDKLHQEMHAIFKPDDIAQSRAVQAHRAKHPAADHAAEAIVIYPLNRKGAPGF